MHVVNMFIQKWRESVGNDIYPAFRLILPDKDKDRAVYGLKEKALGRLWTKVLNLAPDSPDAQALSQWKQGAQTSTGNFSQRCYEVIVKRETRSEFGEMGLEEVNAMLDELANGETDQAKQIELLTTFYKRMNATELKWLVRMILRHMHIGATEKVFFRAWHPDGESLYNVTASLKRVCWELTDPTKRLSSDEQQVGLFSCFIPQIASFPKYSSNEIASKNFKGKPFYIEEKVDGERIQMHMSESGQKFRFWSRRAKDYTDTYGDSFDCKTGSLTKRLRGIINPNVRNCILDGEMVAYDPQSKMIIPFGTLKTANFNEQRNKGLTRPMYLVFDIIYLNDTPLVDYSLADRKRALTGIFTEQENGIIGKESYLEVLPYTEATTAEEIDSCLRKIIVQDSEGLVIKDPSSPYVVNARMDTWLKLKPEYMSEFGENLDVVILGGYYGSGKRANILSSYLCGLRVDGTDKFWSFCKVGGGLAAYDYQQIRHITDGKWTRWDVKTPPPNILLAGPDGDYEKPDVWIDPKQSLVVEVKAASVYPTEQYKVGLTLRFPRFRSLRYDKGWEDGLTVSQFTELRQTAEAEAEHKSLELEDRKRGRAGVAPTGRAKRVKLINLSSDEDEGGTDEAKTDALKGTQFCILSDMLTPRYMSKVAVENLVKKHGGTVSQKPDESPGLIPIADKKVIKVNTLLLRDPHADVVRPNWLLDCISEKSLVALEPRNLLSCSPATALIAKGNVDEFGDSYTRPLTYKEISEVLRYMDQFILKEVSKEDSDKLFTGIPDALDSRGLLFMNKTIYFDSHFSSLPLADQFRASDAKRYLEFGGANLVTDTNLDIVVAVAKSDQEARELRIKSADRLIPFRVVSLGWVLKSWEFSNLEIEQDYPVLKDPEPLVT